jgi:hypothetical protein
VDTERVRRWYGEPTRPRLAVAARSLEPGPRSAKSVNENIWRIENLPSCFLKAACAIGVATATLDDPWGQSR